MASVILREVIQRNTQVSFDSTNKQAVLRFGILTWEDTIVHQPFPFLSSPPLCLSIFHTIHHVIQPLFTVNRSSSSLTEALQYSNSHKEQWCAEECIFPGLWSIPDHGNDADW